MLCLLLLLFCDSNGASKCVSATCCISVSTKRYVLHHMLLLRFNSVRGRNLWQVVGSNYHPTLSLISHSLLCQLVLRRDYLHSRTLIKGTLCDRWLSQVKINNLCRRGQGRRLELLLLIAYQLLSIMIALWVLMDSNIPRNTMFIYQINYGRPACGLSDWTVIIPPWELRLIFYLPDGCCWNHRFKRLKLWSTAATH